MSQNHNSKFNRYFATLGGATMTTGGSLNLAKGQFGVFAYSAKDATKDGQKAISTFAGRDRDDKYVIKVGRSNGLAATRSQSNKSLTSVPFSVNDVVSVGVSAPKTTEQKVDDVILGYNGIDADTAITLTRADRKKITLELSGELIGMYGYPDNKLVTTVYLDPKKYYGTEVCETGDNCEAVDARPYILEAIETLRRFQMIGGVPLETVVDITPVDSSTPDQDVDTELRYYQTLTTNDTGDQQALAMVQAQYPLNKLVRINQSGIQSVYQTMTETDTLLTAYTQSAASLIKGCEDCPAGYTEIAEGFVYNVKIEDDGADLTTTVDNLPGFVTGTVDKIGQVGGKGEYTVVLTAELTDAQIATYIGTSATQATAEISLIGEVTALCTSGATTTTAWVLGDSCEVTTQNYTIVLADDECGENKLTELQAHYPDLNVVVADSETSTRTITLTGSSGTANVAVAGTNYLATYATSLTVTAANFVTAHAAAILTATGATVTSSGAVLTFTDATTGFPTLTITNATTNLAGTLGTLTAVPSTGGCQTKYQAEVITNMVCEECDPIFRDFFISEAPRPYETEEWELVETTAPTGTLMGIRFRGKKLQIRSNEYLRDKIGYTESSVQIRVTGGQIDEVRAGIGELVDEQYKTTYLSHWEPVTHMGGEFQWLEERDRMYFTGEQVHDSAMTRVLFTDEESVIDQSKQYIDYSITVRRTNFAQQPSNRFEETITYHILTEVGRHTAVETLINSIAGAAGIKGAKAFGE